MALRGSRLAAARAAGGARAMGGARRRLSAVVLHHRVVEPEAPPSRPPLVLLHGLFGSSSNFGQVARRCSAELSARVLLPDLRNHGQSPWEADCSFESMGDDVIRMLDGEGVDRAVLCGHSLGGKAVMAASLLHPERVVGMICVDIAPVEYPANSADWSKNQEIKATMASMPEEMLASRKLADEALKAVVTEAGVRQFLLMNLIPDERCWRVNLEALIASTDILRSFPSLPVAQMSLPAQFIAGQRSKYLTLEEQRQAAQALFPSATFESVPTGHWVHAEAPEIFVKLVCKFYQENNLDLLV